MTVKQYYQILEVSSTATAEDIKSAYRRLSLQWHPDRNPNNLEEAIKKFTELSEAYEVLSDENLRVNYDRESVGRGIFGSCSTHNFNPRPAEEVFREFFQGQDPFPSTFGYSAPPPTVFGGMGDGNHFPFGGLTPLTTTPTTALFGNPSGTNSGTGGGGFSFSPTQLITLPAAPIRPANVTTRSGQPMFSFGGSTSGMRDGSQSLFGPSTAPTLVTSLTPPTPRTSTTPPTPQTNIGGLFSGNGSSNSSGLFGGIGRNTNTVWESSTSTTTRIENGNTTVTQKVVQDGVETITVHVNGVQTHKSIRNV